MPEIVQKEEDVEAKVIEALSKRYRLPKELIQTHETLRSIYERTNNTKTLTRKFEWDSLELADIGMALEAVGILDRREKSPTFEIEGEPSVQHFIDFARGVVRARAMKKVV